MGEIIWGVDFAKPKEIRTREDAVDELARQLAAALPEYDLSYSLIDHAKQGAPLNVQSHNAAILDRIVGVPAIQNGDPNVYPGAVEMPADCPA